MLVQIDDDLIVETKNIACLERTDSNSVYIKYVGENKTYWSHKNKEEAMITFNKIKGKLLSAGEK